MQPKIRVFVLGQFNQFAVRVDFVEDNLGRLAGKFTQNALESARRSASSRTLTAFRFWFDFFHNSITGLPLLDARLLQHHSTLP